METTFENAQVGDRVYSPLFRCKNPEDKTNATIIGIGTKGYSIGVRLDIIQDLGNTGFTPAGEYSEGGGQVLFWSKPEFEVPVRPKRMVKKKVWLGYLSTVNRNSDGKKWHSTTCLYEEKEKVALVGEEFKLLEVEIEVEE